MEMQFHLFGGLISCEYLVLNSYFFAGMFPGQFSDYLRMGGYLQAVLQATDSKVRTTIILLCNLISEQQ